MSFCISIYMGKCFCFNQWIMTDYGLSHQPLVCESQFLLMLFMPDLIMLVVSSIVGESAVCHCV